jgi:predicted metal-dependent hydrolase
MIISGIPIEVYKKNIKNMHLYVKPPDGNVVLSAPLSMSDEVIERFLRTKVSWIKRQISMYESQPRQSEREYVSGETLYVWGKQYYLHVNYGGKNSLILIGDTAELTVRKNSTALQRGSFVREWYRDLLKADVERVMPKWEAITGLKAVSWQTKYMSSRWGSCNTETGKIWLNVQLAKKTPECLEYIILHELIHLVEKNHSKQFIRMMDKYMPMWREIRTKLNEQTLDFLE